jgi:ATP-dependent Zn protease
MAKECIMMKKRFEEDGFLYTQDCLTGFTLIEKAAKKEVVVPTITTTASTTKKPFVEIPRFFLEWQERRDNRG